MAVDKVVDSAQLDAAMTATAAAIRTAGGTSARIAWDKDEGFRESIMGKLSGILLDNLEVVTPPNKTTYSLGETFDYTGLVLKATYTNGATREITGGWIEPEDTTATLNKTHTGVLFEEYGISRWAFFPITLLNPVTESAAVATGLNVNNDAPLRAITYYDGRYLAVETASATEQFYKSNFTKAAPTAVTRTGYNANRPYPANAIITDGNLVWIGNTTDRSVAPYSNRYLLRAPYSTFITTASDALNVFAVSGVNINACAGWLSGYCWFVGKDGSGNGFVARCAAGGTVSTQTYSGIGELDYVGVGNGYLVAVSNTDKKVIVLRDPLGSWTENIYTLSDYFAITPLVSYLRGATLRIIGKNASNELVHAIYNILSSGFEHVFESDICNGAEDYESFTAFQSTGRCMISVAVRADGSRDMILCNTLYARAFPASVASPVLSCAADGGMTVIGKADGKYTLTQLTEAST